MTERDIYPQNDVLIWFPVKNDVFLQSNDLETTTVQKLKREEASDILHHLLPQLEAVNIPIINIKVDVTTRKTNPLRGDVWISKEQVSSKSWEKNIVCLIEAKSKNATVGSREWNTAIRDGKEKATLQGLPFFIVTNTTNSWKYYRTNDGKEIFLDGVPVEVAIGLHELELANTQISTTNLNVVRAKMELEKFYSEKDFQSVLYQVKNIYRNCAIDDIDSKISTTITFVVLKYITEQEAIHRTLDEKIMLWGDWRDNNIDRDIKATIEDIQSSKKYAGVVAHLKIDNHLTASHCEEIRNLFGKFQFSGCNFDLYGTVYESFADKNTKEEFGEYYTRRHIARMLSELVLRNEIIPRPLELCDPACGTGGFLTESFRILLRNYTASGNFTTKVNESLKKEIFYGYDIKEKNISLSRINMCLAGDGHTNIVKTPDSLITLEEKKYDYILTNVPYGVYKGSVNMENFKYAQKKRFENLFLEKVVKSLKYGGRAVVIIPDGILESPSLNDFRINFLKDVKVEAVISLHKYVFRPYTTEKTYAIIFQRKLEEQVGRFSNYDIFMYILENDGLQKGDKRYPIRENNIPDLLKNYMTASCEAPSTFVNIASVNEQNFHNLTPEFYLNYYESNYKDVDMEGYNQILSKLNKLSAVLENPFS